MLSDTLSKGLDRYAIGEKLRRLRLRRQFGLVELGRHTGLSPALLSKLERGLMIPTLPTLLRIALVFSVGLEEFFIPEPKPVLEVVRKRDRLRFANSKIPAAVSYFFESLDFPATNRKLDAYYADFEAVDPAKMMRHEHAGVELLYMIAGRLELHIGERVVILAAGDSIYFDSAVPHGYRRSGTVAASAIVVTAPA